MSSTIKQLPKSEVEITITVSYEDWKKGEKAALEEISKEIKVDGFRSGNIPEDVIRKEVDKKTIASVTLEKVIPLTYAAAVKEHDVQVIAQPKVDITKHAEKEGDEMVYTATVSVMPEVKIGDYKKIKVKRPEVKVEKKQVEETMTMIMDRFAEWVDVKRKVKEGDRVEITFEGFDEKGKAIPNTASKNHPLVVGSKTMIPGFEDAVVGMEVGGEKEFDVTFPKDYHAKNMQGQKVKFKLSVGRVEEKKEQKLDESMIEKATGQKQSVEEFKKKVEEDLGKEMEQRAQRDHDNAVVQEIIKITKVDLPEILVEDELKQMLEDQKAKVAQQGISWEQYLQHVKKSEEDFLKDHKQAAEDRLLARFGVTHIIKDSKIEVDDKDVEAKVAEMISQYPAEHQEKAKEFYKKDSDHYRSLKNNMAADKLIDMLSK